MEEATSTSRESFSSPWREVNTNLISTLRSCSGRVPCQKPHWLLISNDQPLSKAVSYGFQTVQRNSHADASPGHSDPDWNPQQFLDSDANPLTARDNWMNPGVSFPVGSSTLSASNRVQFAPENSFAQIEGVNPIAPFTSNEIIFTGNG
jgi:hypothetical protein